MSVILLRVNLDIEGRNPEKSPRFISAVKTLRSFSKATNKIVILAHMGRPGRIQKKLSLKPFERLLSKNLKRKITFFPKFNFSQIRREIKESKPGSIFLLENLRFLPGENKNDAKLAKNLASLGTAYVNDDFPTSHHENASNVMLAKIMGGKLGPSFRSELGNLNRIIRNPRRPMVLIIGGTKMMDKIGIIEKLLPKVDFVLLGGGPANTFLKARGFNVKKSIYEPELVSKARKLLRSRKIVLPIDWKWGNAQILDVGPETVKRYSQIIGRAKTIVWGGPLGLFEKKGFEKGTYGVARAIAKSKGFSLVGGGDTTDAIMRLRLEKKIDFISTGGGAMLYYLSGKKLPALKYLKK